MGKPDARGTLIWGGIFGLLAAVLLWSRLEGLDLSFWHDEIYTVTEYAGQGPRAIFFSEWVPNNHVLYEILAWATTRVLGTSEVVFRLWSVLPAIAATVWLTWWCSRRFGYLAGTSAGLMMVVAPLLLEHSRQARGYGLGLLAMTGLVTQADSSIQKPDGGGVWRFALFGLIGMLTLPVFLLPFLFSALALFFDARIRKRLLLAVSTSGILALAWYSPMLGEILKSSSQEYGTPVPWHGFVTLSMNQLLFPIFRLLLPGDPNTMHENLQDGWVATLLWHSILWTLFVAGGLWLWRGSQRILLGSLALPTIGTYAVMAGLGMWTMSRFVSYLSVPLFILLALGVHAVADLVPSKGRLVSHLALVGMAAWLLVSFYPVAERVTWVPLEALKDASHLANESGADLVVTNSVRPIGFEFYLDTPLEIRDEAELASIFCSDETGYVFLEHHPVPSEPVDTSCLETKGVDRTRLYQRIRGLYIDVWLVGLPDSDSAP